MSNSPRLDDRENFISRSLLTTAQMLSRQLDRDLRSLGDTSSTDYLVMIHLAANDSQSARMTELADAMMWSKSRLSHQVARMHDRELVSRSSCAQDGRGLVVGLTEKGVATLREAAPLVQKSVENHVVAQLSDDELATLEIVVKKLVAHLGAAEQNEERGNDREPSNAHSSEQ